MEMASKLWLARDDGTLAEAEPVCLVEVAEICGVKKPRAHELTTAGAKRRQHPFPAPIGRTRQGRFWHKPDVERWHEAQEQRKRANEEERAARRRELLASLEAEPVSLLEAAAAADAEKDWLAEIKRIAEGR
jgi:hypothetical protein